MIFTSIASGFTALPAGMRGASGSIRNFGNLGIGWTASRAQGNTACSVYLGCSFRERPITNLPVN